mmetsp:Transcript_6362/g.17702  ORF Transcript_6362/g.17702 Transcript_6362/m.17702 type:complete len:310 (+) Transcript_6362:306-1235(+)
MHHSVAGAAVNRCPRRESGQRAAAAQAEQVGRSLVQEQSVSWAGKGDVNRATASCGARGGKRDIWHAVLLALEDSSKVDAIDYHSLSRESLCEAVETGAQLGRETAEVSKERIPLLEAAVDNVGVAFDVRHGVKLRLDKLARIHELENRELGAEDVKLVVHERLELGSHLCGQEHAKQERGILGGIHVEPRPELEDAFPLARVIFPTCEYLSLRMLEVLAKLVKLAGVSQARQSCLPRRLARQFLQGHNLRTRFRELLPQPLEIHHVLLSRGICSPACSFLDHLDLLFGKLDAAKPLLCHLTLDPMPEL